MDKESKMDKNNILKVLFIILSCIPFLSILLFGLAVLYFPGGPNPDGFSFWGNTMSDLGKIIANNGEDNTISRILYSIALTLLSCFILVYYSVIWTYFQDKKSTKWLSIIGTAIGILQSIWYLGLTFTPDDTMHSTHLIFIYGASAFLVAAIVIYDITYFLKRDFTKLNTYSYLAMFIIAFIFMLSVAIAPIFGSEIGMLPRRAGHTLFIFIECLVYGLQGIGAYHYTKKQSISANNYVS
jgi:hypothetical protein